jgi:response regulator RpfG family c-di-GMP phosphodiesterase
MNNILVIDDNTYILEALALRIGMSMQNWNVLTAKNGKEGTEIMDSQPVSFVLTDIQMPVMDGYGVIEHKNRNYPLIPLFVMTANCDFEVKEKLEAMHVAECIEKPFDFDNLLLRMIQALGAEPEADAIPADPVHRKLAGKAA